MKALSNPILFTIVVLIWGSTWLAITFQYGEVDPTLSVAYRFLIAASILFVYCKFKKLSLHLPTHIHIKMAVAGLCLYTLDYSFLYQSQQHLISGIVAVMSSGMIYINVLLRRILLKKAIRYEVIIGASVGLVGIALIFLPEFSQMNTNQYLILGIGFALASFLSASLGNVISERILDHGTPVVQMNFWAMTYGVILTFIVTLVTGVKFTFPTHPHYFISILYLSVFGSVIAFGAYMQLVKKMGSDKAAYVVLIYPIIALILSTFFEDYEWHTEAFMGVALVLIGKGIAMGKLSINWFGLNK